MEMILDANEKKVLILHGGVDVSPHYYHQNPLPMVQQPDDRRDAREFKAVLEAIANKIPIIGICRGAQLLCIAAGGSLWQHSEGHGRSHPLDYKFKGKTGRIKSAMAGHHQIMNLHGTSGEVIAWCPHPTTVYYESGEKTSLALSPEVVWFPSIKAIGIQPHPEWEPERSEFVDFVREVVFDKLGLEGVF